MITVQKHAKTFKQFQSLTMLTYLELGITDGISVSLVSPWLWRSAAKQSDWLWNFLFCNHQEHIYFLITLYKHYVSFGGFICSYVFAVSPVKLSWKSNKNVLLQGIPSHQTFNSLSAALCH
jgi:hypothetical protein